MRGILIAAAAGVALFVVFHLAILGVGGELALPGWDLTRVFWADLAAMRRMLLEGALPLWNPYDRGGYPFAAEPQSRVFDPLTWVFVGIALLLGAAPVWLTTVQVAVYYAIAASGFAAWLRDHGLSSWAQAVGTAAFLLCGRMDKLKDQSGLWPAAWTGWFLFALERCVRAPCVRRGVGLGAATGMLVVSGYPPMVFRMGLLALPLTLVALVGRWRELGADGEDADGEDGEDGEGSARRRYLVALVRAGAAALFVSAGISAAQLVATMQVLPATTRASLDKGHLLASRVELGHALGFIAPHELTAPLLIYAGALGLGLTVLALVRARGQTRARVGVLLFIVGLGFLLATGDNGPLLPKLVELPGFRSFRIAGHYLLLCSIGFAALIAHGCAQLDALAEAEDARARRWASALLVLAGLAWAGLGPARGVGAWLGGGLAFVSALALLWVGPGRVAGISRRLLLRGAVGVSLLIELFVVGRPIAEILQPPPNPEHAAALARAIEDPSALRVADYRRDARRPGPHTGTRDLIGHRPALTDPLYLEIYHLGARSSGVLRAMNVGAVALPAKHRLARSPKIVPVPGSPGIHRVRDPWPRAFWVDGVRWLDDLEGAKRSLRRGQRPRAIVMRDQVPASLRAQLEALPAHDPRRLGGERSAPVELDARAGQLRARVEAPAPGLVVFSEAPAPGWHASVDGARAQIVRVNLIQQGVWVPAGAHELELRFWPAWTGLLWGWWALTWLGLGLYALVLVRAQRVMPVTRQLP